ncbi:restriction endonuclease subunit S [Carboxylicivirga sediminis]|uniref:Restriction endonuclease subunit S n=1 Tax=Carboxylicivirga sediminis TaxID=2006564 RepID=A0A941F2J3_9BACT|nr:restriction endonuclease subunit S [Carboxylicivirga sediminis]MBR8535119.1 restriction endonuclease subunit S [Carboxylicivirga sediminis]
MQSNYKPIGDYIRLVDERNKDLAIDTLLGLTINKQFIPSVANTVGTDMRNYKIIRKNQFACSTMQVRRDKKMPVALLQDYEEAIISQAYPLFEVKNEKELLPDYLMMWFSRAEFDREACFHAVGGVRGSLEWEDFCNMKFPLPSPDKQNEIVKEYNTIKNRIALNNQLIQKLEETAQAIYKQWFVDFEFPNEKGKPYKSSGGKMVWNEELEKEIPEGCGISALDEVIECFISKRGKSKSLMDLQQFSKEYKYPVISAMNISNGKIVKYDTIPYVNNIDFDEWMNPKLEVDDVLLTSEAPLGETYYLAINSEYALSQRLFALRTKKEKISGWFLYLWLNTPLAKRDLEGRSSGTTVSGIKLSELKKICILIPPRGWESIFNKTTMGISKLIEYKNQENQNLSQLKNLLLSKIATIEN